MDPSSHVTDPYHIQPATTGPDGRDLMIREAAYFLAQARGFAPGHELDDWLAAERQIDAVLASRRAPAKP